MKVKLNALNKDYLVEFKSDDEFVSFTTKFNDKIKNIEIINEDTLPQLQKPVELAKPSKSDGWKALEKSAFTTKEKGVDKKSMELGGGYKEFHYDADKTLASQCDDKVSEPKIDSPALKGEEPKVKDVEATAKENEVEVKDAPKAETSTEPKKEESTETKTEEKPAEDKGEDKAEDKKEEPKEEDEKKEVKESVEGETLTPEEIEEVKNYFMDICADEGQYPTVEEMKEAMRSLDSYGSITNDQYNYCLAHWDEWLNEYEVNAGNTTPINEEYEKDLNDIMLSAGVKIEESKIEDDKFVDNYYPFFIYNDPDKNCYYIAELTANDEVKFDSEAIKSFEEAKEQLKKYALDAGIHLPPEDMPEDASKENPQLTEDAYATKFGTKSLKQMIDGFVKGEFTLKDLREFMQENNIDPAIVDINALLQQKDAELDEATKESFKGEYADTDAEVEADAENKPSEEFKAQLEKNGKLKGDGTDKLDESNSSLDKAYEEAYEVWNNAGSNEDDLYQVCSDVAEKFGVRADDLYNKIKESEKVEIEEASDDKFDRMTAKGDSSKWDYDDKFDRLSDLYNQPSDTVKVKVYDIKWDCDGDDPETCGLPSELELEIDHDADSDLDEEIGDKLSDETGFCHFGFKYDVIKGE